MYSNPHVPSSLLGAVHSSEFRDASITANRKVVVCGSGKSALDCAAAASRFASETHVYRRMRHWAIPQKLFGIVPFQWLAYSRLGHFLLPVHWYVSGRERFLHALLSPLKYVIWRFVELCIMIHYGFSLYGSTRIEIDLFSGGQIVPDSFTTLLHEKNVVLHDGEYDVDDAAVNEDTVVVAATGFIKTYDIFDDVTMNKLCVEMDGLWLYKNIVPPMVCNLAFIGSEITTFNNVLTQHLQAQWLSKNITFENARSYLKASEMLRDVSTDQQWKRSWLPLSKYRAASVQLHMLKYHDMLMDDMGVRAPCLRLMEWHLPLTVAHYVERT